jgi:hypothetical protein
MSKTRKFIIAAAALLALSGTAIAGGKADEAARNIVIVHGAFVDASGWRAVYDILQRDGYRVSIVQEPLTGLADDVAATERVHFTPEAVIRLTNTPFAYRLKW